MFSYTSTPANHSFNSVENQKKKKWYCVCVCASHWTERSNLALAQHIITASVIPFNSDALQRSPVSSTSVNAHTIPVQSPARSCDLTTPPLPHTLVCLVWLYSRAVVRSVSLTLLKGQMCRLWSKRSGLCSKKFLHPHHFRCCRTVFEDLGSEAEENRNGMCLDVLFWLPNESLFDDQ